MKKINFLVEWLPGNKERSWSGTNWGLYKALQKHFDVNDIDIYRPRTFISRVLRKLHLVPQGDLGLANMHKNRKTVLPILSQQKCDQPSVVFQFAEIVSNSSNVHTYIYQDLAVPYIEYMRQHLPKDYAVSTYEDTPLKYVRQRTETQMEYYRTCSGIFTMGKWLKRYLVDECHLQECKIMSIGGGSMLAKI